MKVDYLILGGPRMDALAARFLPEFEACQRRVIESVANAGDLTPMEARGMLLRFSLSMTVGSLQELKLRTGVRMEVLRDFVVEDLNAQLGLPVDLFITAKKDTPNG